MQVSQGLVCMFFKHIRLRVINSHKNTRSTNSLRAPWLKDVWFFGTSYIIPNFDNVVIGGTAGKGDWSTAVSLDDTKRIIDNIAKVFPSIRDAQIVRINLNFYCHFICG